jgi:aerobic C4-dicarboxylate transport protein
MQRRLHLSIQVLIAIALGVALGAFAPGAGRAMKPLADLFLNAVKLVTAPVVFLTVALGVAGMTDLRRAGRVGLSALIYFEILTTIAILLGVGIMHLVAPGAGLDLSGLTPGDATAFVQQGEAMNWGQFLVHMVPSSAVDAFARGDILQVVVVALLVGIALVLTGPSAAGIIRGLGRLSEVSFRMVAIVMRFAPVGAFAAMAFTVGTFGVATLVPLLRLLGSVYAAMLLFVVVVLGGVARWYGFSLFRFLKVIREEILLVLGTSSSEAALPRMLEKLERYGCGKSIVGLVLPAGYAFNLDGTSLYLSMSVLFLAQVHGVHLSVGQLATVIGVLMLTSKGAAGVTGSGFIVLASTLAAVRVVPVESVALLLGIDRFMSEARAIVNVIGNGVATVVISKREGAFDAEAAAALEATA